FALNEHAARPLALIPLRKATALVASISAGQAQLQAPTARRSIARVSRLCRTVLPLLLRWAWYSSRCSPSGRFACAAMISARSSPSPAPRLSASSSSFAPSRSDSRLSSRPTIVLGLPLAVLKVTIQGFVGSLRSAARFQVLAKGHRPFRLDRI